MIIVDIRPAKQWFKRKQWTFTIRAANGEKLDPRDTYANTGDIVAMLHALREDEMEIRTHFAKGMETIVVPGVPF